MIVHPLALQLVLFAIEDPKTLLRASFVCRAWREVYEANIDILWFAMCQKKYLLCPSQLPHQFHVCLRILCRGHLSFIRHG